MSNIVWFLISTFSICRWRPIVGLVFLFVSVSLTPARGAVLPSSATTLMAADLLLQKQISLGLTGDPAIVAFARETLNRRRIILGVTHVDVGHSLSTLAVILDWNQDYRQARVLHNQALAILREQLPADDRQLGLAQLKAGGTYRELRLHSQAEALLDEAHATLLAASGPQSLDVAEVLNVKSNLYRNLGRSDTALATAKQALDIQLTLLPPGHVTLGHTYASLGYIYNSLHRNDEGFEALDRAIDIFSTGLSPDHPVLSFALTTTAGYLLQLGDLQEAERRMLRALRIRGQVYGTNSQPYSVILVRLGRFYNRIGEYEKASECQQKVVAIRRPLQPSGDHTAAIAVWSLAETRIMLGDPAGAKRDLQESLAMYALESQPNPVWQARIHKELGRVELMLGNLQSARSHLDQAGVTISGFDKTSTEIHDYLLVNGDVLQAEGHFELARAAYSEAGRLAATRGSAGHGVLAVALEKQASLEIACGNTAAAEDYLYQTLEILTRQLGPDHPKIADVSLDLALVMADKGQVDQALDLVLDSERRSRAHFRRIARTMSEASALRYARVRPAGIPQALDLISQIHTATDISSVWSEVASSRALVLDEITGRYRRRGDISDTAAAHQQALQTYANLLVRGPSQNHPDRYPAELAAAKTGVEHHEKKLAAGADLNRPPAVDQTIDLDSLRRALPSGASLLAFVKHRTGDPSLAQSHYFGFLMPPDQGVPVFWRVAEAAVVDDLVHQMRSSLTLPIADREASYRTAGDKLCQLIWDPAVELCSAEGSVFIVPDGTLNLISFGALPVSGGQYLLEKRPFQYLTTERDLLWQRPDQLDNQGILALGGADFEADVPSADQPFAPTVVASATIYRSPLVLCPKLQDLVFTGLPGSAEEVHRVASHWSRSRDASPPLVLTGAAATEKAFKNAAAGRDVIHLATHGFVVGSGCDETDKSYRGVGGFVPADDLREHESGRNILSLSGLALAGANRRFSAPPTQEDGILTSLEIATLDLTGTSLVVLSGCDTGGGTIEDSEGVFGLRRAVNIAGAQTLIMSLWPAEDNITRDWMSTMYEHYLFSEKSVSESVRLASLSTLYKRRAENMDTHPAFWGCFIASGKKGW